MNLSKKLCIELAQKEEEMHPDKVLAEIIHISEGRLGNILTRPHYRKYEIPYLAMSTLPYENQIQVSDLMVSIKNDKVILRSKRLNKEVFPRMANAHNYSAMGLPIYHFLCDLQHQSVKSYLGWNWSFLGDENFLPRVTYKNVILSPAYWNVKTIKLKELAKLPDEQKLNKFAEIKQEYELPERTYLSEGDNKLLLDFNNKICLDILLDAAKKFNQLKLTEFLFTDSNLIVKDEQGNSYTNEIIIPFVRINKEVVNEKTAARSKVLKPRRNVIRTFEPYNEWVYFKIYTGTKTADKIITKQLSKITQTLKKEGVIHKWFFIRYADPKNHIRIRFNLTSTDSFNILNNVMQKELSPLVNNGIIWKVQIDTCQREMERYGYGTMGVSEDFFHINSETTLSLLGLFSSDAHQVHRFLIGLTGVVKLYDAYGYSDKERLLLIEQGAKSYGREFGLQNSVMLRDKIKDDYRKLTPKILFLLEGKPTNSKPDEPMYSTAYNRAKKKSKKG
jgi:thiopeptide-type bacteriocin biosynthesis protein